MGKYKDFFRFKNFVSKIVYKKKCNILFIIDNGNVFRVFWNKKKNGLKIKKVLDGNF